MKLDLEAMERDAETFDVEGNLYGVVGDHVRALVARVQELEANAEEEAAIRKKMGGILDAVALALRGPPAPLAMHDWSDLPKLVERLHDRSQRGRLEEKIYYTRELAKLEARVLELEAERDHLQRLMEGSTGPGEDTCYTQANGDCIAPACPLHAVDPSGAAQDALRSLLDDPNVIEAASRAYWDCSEHTKWDDEPDYFPVDAAQKGHSRKDTVRNEMRTVLLAASEAILKERR